MAIVDLVQVGLFSRLRRAGLAVVGFITIAFRAQGGNTSVEAQDGLALLGLAVEHDDLQANAYRVDIHSHEPQPLQTSDGAADGCLVPANR